MNNPTHLTKPAEHGGAQSAAELLPLVYTELRRLARRKLEQEPGIHTLQPTALVHEVYLKLARQEGRRFNDSRHFFAAAAEAMRRILVDQARRRKSLRRGGDFVRVDWPDQDVPTPHKDDQLLLLDEALDRLTRSDPQKADLVKLRYFAGLGFHEVAAALGISEPTAKRYWAHARAWLGREMKRQETG